jgi:hypothetical protein
MSDSGTFTRYTEARNSFTNASGTFQSIIFGKGLKLDIPDTLPYILAPEYLINPAASVSGASFLSSTEQIKKAASEVIGIINNIEKEKNLDKEDLKKLQTVRTEMTWAEKKAEESQQKEFGSLVKDPDKSTEDIMA